MYSESQLGVIFKPLHAEAGRQRAEDVCAPSVAVSSEDKIDTVSCAIHHEPLYFVGASNDIHGSFGFASDWMKGDAPREDLVGGAGHWQKFEVSVTAGLAVESWKSKNRFPSPTANDGDKIFATVAR